MNGRKVFLTGGTGFVGRAVLAELLRDDWRVRCLVRSEGQRRLPRDDRVEPVTGDLLEPADCRRRRQGASAAVHLVGIIHETGNATFQGIHVEGTRNVVEACAASGARRLVHMSAHGASPTSRAAYHRTKAEGERIVRESPLGWTIFQPSVILGLGGAFAQQMIDLVRPRWRPVPILGDGGAILQPLGVEEVAHLAVRSLTTPAAEGQTYGLGGPAAVTLEEFLDTLGRIVCGRRRAHVHVPMGVARLLATVAEKLTKRPPITREQLIMLAEAKPVDIAPAVRNFQWQPKPLETLLRQSVGKGSEP